MPVSGADVGAEEFHIVVFQPFTFSLHVQSLRGV